MAKTREYQHFCPVARSLEVIGEKWSLLIVRDLLRGPQRFTDLMRYLGGITPKWLTLRLRDLEAAGIIERDQEQGRREVWYRLTPRGRDLAPVVESLAIWGIDHARRPPLPDEPINLDNSFSAATLYRNRRAIRLDAPAVWAFHFNNGRAYTMTFDGERWTWAKGAPEESDVQVRTTPEEWSLFLMVSSKERRRVAETIDLQGTPGAVAAFRKSYGLDKPADPVPEAVGVSAGPAGG